MLPLAQAAIDDFYRTFASVSFTLLGLWWVVVTTRFQAGAGDPRRRRHAYGISAFFMLPGLMSLLSAINSDVGTLWRVSFGACAVLGIAEFALYLSSGGRRTAGAVLLRAVGLALYVLIAVVAIRPQLAEELRLGLAPREAEAILLGLLLVVGANLAWLSVTEAEETAGA